MSEEILGDAASFGPYMDKWTWNNGAVQYVFYCPGCKSTHRYDVVIGDGCVGPVWSFNENPEAPTFTPSLVYKSTAKTHTETCHLYVIDGNIQYLTDCTHELAGKTIPMIEWKKR